MTHETVVTEEATPLQTDALGPGQLPDTMRERIGDPLKVVFVP